MVFLSGVSPKKSESNLVARYWYFMQRYEKQPKRCKHGRSLFWIDRDEVTSYCESLGFVKMP